MGERYVAVDDASWCEACGRARIVTPEMIAAGANLLADEWGVIGPHAAEELAEAVFRAMIEASGSGERSEHDKPDA